MQRSFYTLIHQPSMRDLYMHSPINASVYEWPSTVRHVAEIEDIDHPWMNHYYNIVGFVHSTIIHYDYYYNPCTVCNFHLSIVHLYTFYGSTYWYISFCNNPVLYISTDGKESRNLGGKLVIYTHASLLHIHISNYLGHSRYYCIYSLKPSTPFFSLFFYILQCPLLS